MRSSSYLERDNITKIIFKLALPAMLAQFITVLYSIIDRLYISNMGGNSDYALAGIGIAAPIVTFIASFSYLVGSGGAPLVGIYLGEKSHDKAKKILSNSFMLLIMLGIVIPSIILIFHNKLIYFFGATENTFDFAKNYLLFYLIGAPFAIIGTGLNLFVISQGNSGMGMFTMVIGAIVNIILDPLFIFTFDLGIIGAAIATAISQFCSFLFVLLMMIFKCEVKISFGNYEFSLMGKILKLGFSPFIIMMTDSLMGLFLNSSIKMNSDNADVYITATTISTSFYQLFSMPLLGISGGTSSAISYNYGAKNVERVKNCEKHILLLALVFTTISFILSFFIAKPFINLFTSDQEIIKIARRICIILMSSFILLSFQYCFVDGLTALSKPKYAISLSLTRKISMIVLVFLLPVFLNVDGCFYAQLVSDILASLVTFLTFIKVFPKILKMRLNSAK